MVWVTSLPLASVKVAFAMTCMPAAPVWSRTAVHLPPCRWVGASVQVVPPS